MGYICNVNFKGKVSEVIVMFVENLGFVINEMCICFLL